MRTAIRFLFLPALLLAAHSAGATTIRRIADRDLVDLSPVVALVTVEARLPWVADRPATDWLLRVDRVLKGRLDQGSVVVRLPGGLDPKGRFLRIFGAPPFEVGAEAIVFLTPGDQDTWSLVEFPQGAFLADRTKRHKVAVRDFSEVRLIERGRVEKREPLRDFEGFADWIADLDAGLRPRADYEIDVRSSDLRAEVRAFTMLEDTFGRPFRWFEFDTGTTVQWRISADGYSELSGGGEVQLQQTLAAWNNEPNTPLTLKYSGTSSATSGLETYDNVNVVLLKDPNDEISGSYSCRFGGTLAIGGPWTDGTVQSAKGTNFAKIIGGDVVFQDGIECEAQSTNFGAFVAELMTHEVGHTLGLDHSSESADEPNAVLRDATMFKSIHDDGRGAALRADDIAGLRSLYDPSVPFQRSGLPTSSTPGVPPSGSCPGNTLCLLGGRFQVTGTWRNQFDGSAGTALPIRSSDLAGFFYFTDPANIELIVKILDFGSEIKVFYSQLTNLEFTLAVKDTLTGKTKTYSNTAGDCGAIDPDFASSTVGSLSSGAGSEARAAASAGTCSPSATTLCLGDDRFAINVGWRNQFNGASGAGAAGKLSRLTGSFSFDDPRNLEILIKVLEFDGKILVLWGSLSNFEYSIRITDTATGAVRTFENPAGRFCGGLDDDAF